MLQQTPASSRIETTPVPDSLAEPSSLGPTGPDELRPTNIRWGVFSFLFVLMFVLYLDRLCIGIVAPAMQRDLNLTDAQMGNVFAAFLVAYGLFEVVTGHWGDRVGTRAVLTRIVIWWSVFTALTGMARSYLFLFLTRFLFGAGEAGALPNVARVTATWFPQSSQGWVRGAVHMPALLGGMVAPPATAYLIGYVSWRGAFIIYGLLGLIWAASFYLWFRNHPREHRSVNAAEVELIGEPPPNAHGSIPWKAIVENRNVWLLGTVLVAGSCTVYTLLSWYPSYLVNVRGETEITAGWLSAVVMLGGVIGCLVGGWTADKAQILLPHSRWSRSAVGGLGFSLAAVSMVAGANAPSTLWMSVWFAIACAGIHLHAAAWWGVAADIGGGNVGSLFAMINSIGALGAAVALKGFGEIDRAYWGATFGWCGLILALGAACWLCVDNRIKLVVAAAEECSPDGSPA